MENSKKANLAIWKLDLKKKKKICRVTASRLSINSAERGMLISLTKKTLKTLKLNAGVKLSQEYKSMKIN
jgi:hypothetical protein